MSIFKAYDIRGIYNDNLDKKTAYDIGRSFVLFLEKKNPKIVIARDGRLSSPELLKYLKKGIIDQGGTVYDIGLATTPMFYFADCCLKTDGGIMVTASHNPKEYNGFKIVGEKAIPISEKTGLKDIKEIISILGALPKKKGKAIKKNITSEYIKDITSEFDLKTYNFKIGIDTANSVGGLFIDKIFKKSNCKIYHLNKEVDGNFPNHNPDPLEKKNLKQLVSLIKEKKLDMGVAFDGDSDRAIFIDNNGKVISSDVILAFIADLMGEKTLCDVRCSSIVRDVMGDKLKISRVGHSFIKQIMKDNNIVLGGEYSGHFYLNKKNCFEAPFFFLFSILEQKKLSEKSLSELVKPYQIYAHSGEINFRLDNPKEKIKEIEKKYDKGKKTKIDGVRIDFDDWWLLVRLSNTEPILR
jgi:phosphomannomutase